MEIFTVGYGGRGKEDFLALMQSNNIQTVVDIRLRPDRASMGIWVLSKDPNKGIVKWLSDGGIKYHSLIELGNIFLEFNNWKESYRQLLKTSGELLIERLMKIPGTFCLLCAEKSFAECHRLQVAEYLIKYKKALVHHLE